MAALLAALAGLVPFLASGRIGILGAGTNDDMAEHLLAAWTLQGHVPLAASKLVSSTRRGSRALGEGGPVGLRSPGRSHVAARRWRVR